MTKKRLTFEHILTPAGTISRQTLVIGEDGRIEAIEDAGECRSDGYLALPGMPNAHSHSFQRALCGYGERRGGAGRDSFWSWREHMYRLAAAITPDDLYVISRQAFGEMLAAGFTSVAEFHYLHHLPDGGRGPDMALAVMGAAADTGIRLRLLPVLYQQGGFGKPPAAEQARFVHRDIDDYCRLLDALKAARPGFAPHSLRAVDVKNLAGALNAVSEVLGENFPVHMHISEQIDEVEECVARFGSRPLELLSRHTELSSRWNLVHGTNFDASERRLAAAKNCQLVLCPLTEAYLGDGIFDAVDYLSLAGRWAIGSDSNARIDAIAELRWLEYGQRLRDRLRARLATDGGFADSMWQGACDGGAQAIMMDVGRIEPGFLADLVVLEKTGALAGTQIEYALDAWLVGGSRENIARVFVGGEEKFNLQNDTGHLVEQQTRFTKTLDNLFAGL